MSLGSCFGQEEEKSSSQVQSTAAEVVFFWWFPYGKAFVRAKAAVSLSEYPSQGDVN